MSNLDDPEFLNLNETIAALGRKYRGSARPSNRDYRDMLDCAIGNGAVHAVGIGERGQFRFADIERLVLTDELVRDGGSKFWTFDQLLGLWRAEARASGIEFSRHAMESYAKRLVSEGEIPTELDGDVRKFLKASVRNVSVDWTQVVSNWPTYAEAAVQIARALQSAGYIVVEAYRDVLAEMTKAGAETCSCATVNGVLRVNTGSLSVLSFVERGTNGRVVASGQLRDLRYVSVAQLQGAAPAPDDDESDENDDAAAPSPSLIPLSEVVRLVVACSAASGSPVSDADAEMALRGMVASNQLGGASHHRGRQSFPQWAVDRLDLDRAVALSRTARTDWIVWEDACAAASLSTDQPLAARHHWEGAVRNFEMGGVTYFSREQAARCEIRRGRLQSKDFLWLDEVIERWQLAARALGVELTLTLLERLLKRMVSEGEIRAFREADVMKFRLSDVEKIVVTVEQEPESRALFRTEYGVFQVYPYGRIEYVENARAAAVDGPPAFATEPPFRGYGARGVTIMPRPAAVTPATVMPAAAVVAALSGAVTLDEAARQDRSRQKWIMIGLAVAVALPIIALIWAHFS